MRPVETPGNARLADTILLLESCSRGDRHGSLAVGTLARTHPWGFASLDEERRLLAGRAGLENLTALQAATVTAARALGDDRIGRVRRGAIADLVLVGADPIADIAAITDVWHRLSSMDGGLHHSVIR